MSKQKTQASTQTHADTCRHRHDITHLFKLTPCKTLEHDISLGKEGGGGLSWEGGREGFGQGKGGKGGGDGERRVEGKGEVRGEAGQHTSNSSTSAPRQS